MLNTNLQKIETKGLYMYLYFACFLYPTNMTKDMVTTTSTNLSKTDTLSKGQPNNFIQATKTRAKEQNFK